MGKKKRNHPDIEEILARPWCYYCERDFDDLKILINHQRAKHFMCERCGRRLNTAGGLSVHMNQVHKETLSQIDNALPNRANLDVEIFGMEGIPEDIVQAHQQRVLQQFAQTEADRRAASGQPGPGGGSGSASKKPKFETPSEMKKRLAEHKARKAADEAAATANPVPAPVEANGAQASGYAHGPTPGFSGAPHYPPQQMPSQQLPYGASPNQNAYGASPPPFMHSVGQFPSSQSQFLPQVQGFNAAPSTPYGQPSFSPPPQQYPQLGFQPPPFQHSPQPHFPGGPPRPFGANTPSAPQRVQSPPQNMQHVHKQNSLPNAPGLPQRPNFNAPNVNHAQMQQLHHGQFPNTPNANVSHHNPPASSASPSNNGPHTVPTNGFQSLSTPIVLADAKPADEAPKEKEKKSKKDKDKDIKLVYSDNDTSPEEKMAQLSRYAFDPKEHEEKVLGKTTASVTGPVRSYEDEPTRNNGP